MKIVIDTCVFVEALLADDETDSSMLLGKIENAKLRLVFSMDMIGELLYILKRECNKIEFSYEETNKILWLAITFFQSGKSVNTKKVKSGYQAADPDDQMLVETAIASGASYIITLDRKSGIFELDQAPFKCVTPKEYLTHVSEKCER